MRTITLLPLFAFLNCCLCLSDQSFAVTAFEKHNGQAVNNNQYMDTSFVHIDTIKPGSEKHYFLDKLLDESEITDNVITFVNTADSYPSITYYFHDDSGKAIRKIRQDQFEIFNPVLNLKLPISNTSESEGPFRAVWGMNLRNKDKIADSTKSQILSALQTLSKYGIKTEDLNNINYFHGKPSFTTTEEITLTHFKYLIRLERAVLVVNHRPDEERKNQDDFDESNGELIDFTTISTYNDKGNLVKVFQLPHRLVNHAWISEDGKYLLCADYKSLWGDEGIYELANCLFIIDTYNGSISEIKLPIEEGNIANIEGFFADDFFQLDLTNHEFMFINPYDKIFYFVSLNTQEIRSKGSVYSNWQSRSFTPYEGVKIDLGLYKPVYYK
jgi:hypothetical protein